MFWLSFQVRVLDQNQKRRIPSHSWLLLLRELSSSGDFRNFVQCVPIPLWKNFESFRSISAEIQDLASMKFVLKKKKFLKPKQIFILYTEKPQKEKKKEKQKRNEMNKGTCTINYKFIGNINKIINYCCLVVSLVCLSFINYNLLYCYFLNSKIINCCLA